MKKFYRHLSDLIMEGVKAFSITDNELQGRYVISGVEETFKHLPGNQNIIVVCGHSGNWEWASLACPLVFKHQCAVIITPFSNSFFNRKITASRSRNGYKLIDKANFKNYISSVRGESLALFFLSDQSPSDPENAYWAKFLGVETPVQFGIEKYAKELDTPIYYIDVKRIKRGYYEANVSILIADPKTENYGNVIKKVTTRISESIIDRPSDWLWSHRRWKHKKKDH